MSKLIYAIIITLLIGLIPIIPYEEEIQHGVTIIEHKSIAEWTYTRYTDVQSQSK